MYLDFRINFDYLIIKMTLLLANDIVCISLFSHLGTGLELFLEFLKRTVLVLGLLKLERGYK